MKSKVLLLALATTAFSLTSKAQKISFGVRAGINFQNLNGETANGHDYEYDMKSGYHFGINAEVPVAPDFYVQPGLLYSKKGAKDEVTGDDIKYKLNYLEIPINVLYKPALGPGRLLLGFGPYIGIGIGGKVKQGDFSADIKWKNDANSTEYYRTYKRMDFGGNLLAGYELSNKVSVQLNAQLGMANLRPKVNGNKTDDKLKNTGFGFSVGYRF